MEVAGVVEVAVAVEVAKVVEVAGVVVEVAVAVEVVVAVAVEEVVEVTGFVELAMSLNEVVGSGTGRFSLTPVGACIQWYLTWLSERNPWSRESLSAKFRIQYSCRRSSCSLFEFSIMSRKMYSRSSAVIRSYMSPYVFLLRSDLRTLPMLVWV